MQPGALVVGQFAESAVEGAGAEDEAAVQDGAVDLSLEDPSLHKGQEAADEHLGRRIEASLERLRMIIGGRRADGKPPQRLGKGGFVPVTEDQGLHDRVRSRADAELK